MLRLFRICIELKIRLRGDTFTLLLYWNHKDENDQVVRVSGDLYDRVYGFKDNWCDKSYQKT